jgi:hypothetical protein
MSVLLSNFIAIFPIVFVRVIMELGMVAGALTFSKIVSILKQNGHCMVLQREG